MKAPITPSHETSRLSSLKALNILDTPPEERFDRITRIAKSAFKVPIALVSLVDENRQWFKSCFGLSVSQTGRDISFCGHAILEDEVFVIEDALADSRFSDNPLVTHEPFIRFYAGCPLKTDDGEKIGTLCIIDRSKRTFSEADKEDLKNLTQIVERELLNVRSMTMDEETQVSNKAGLLDLADYCIESSVYAEVPITLAELNVKVQSSLHMEEAHKAIIVMANKFKTSLRDMDLFARVDENRFELLLPNCEEDEAEMLLSAYLSSVNEELTEHQLMDFIDIQFKTQSLDPKSKKTKQILEAL
jgi:GGDEF domain-containing protein